MFVTADFAVQREHSLVAYSAFQSPAEIQPASYRSRLLLPLLGGPFQSPKEIQPASYSSAALEAWLEEVSISEGDSAGLLL